jgi:N-acetylglutamate synthase-like GNAT family acetyltransferase
MTGIAASHESRLSHVGATFHLRDATPDDNAALIELTAACTMRGDIALRMDRAPDFFALNRLEGDASRVGVATDGDGRIVGCVAAARRRAYVNGDECTIGYVSDLKVHPDARRSGAADLLARSVTETCAELCGVDAPVVCTILAGNAPMEHRTRGPRGAPVLSRFATLSVLAVPLLWERRERVDGLQVRAADSGDLEAMATTWQRYARARQFADVHDDDTLAGWIRQAPGLELGDYLIATDTTGRVRGFLGVWDQTGFKQMRVVGYSPRLAWARRAINVVAPFAGAVPLPQPGGTLPALATVHVCADEPCVLRALLLEAYRRHRGGDYAFLTIGLDERDPLRAAMRKLFAQPTLVHAYVTTAAGTADPGCFTGRLLHHETALV